MDPTRIEQRWLLRWFEALLPGDAQAGLPGAAAVPLDAFLRDFLARAPREPRLGLRLAGLVMAVAGVLRFGRLPGGLDRARRTAVLRALGQSRAWALRELVMLLKLVATLGWCGDPRVARRLGGPEGEPPPSWWPLDDRGPQ